MIIPWSASLAGAWDRYCNAHPLAWFWHRSGWMEYCSHHGDLMNMSFAVVLDDGSVAGLCPIILDGNDLTYQNGPCPEPLYDNRLRACKLMISRGRRRSFNYCHGMRLNDGEKSGGAINQLFIRHNGHTALNGHAIQAPLRSCTDCIAIRLAGKHAINMCMYTRATSITVTLPHQRLALIMHWSGRPFAGVTARHSRWVGRDTHRTRRAKTSNFSGAGLVDLRNW